MTTEVSPAVASNAELERMTPERAAFEAWCCKRWGGDRDALRRRDMAGSERLGEYVSGHVQFAWDAWRAARPKRDKVGRLINLAADCAQRKPLRSLAPLTEATHIGHRQFGRAYDQADDALAVLSQDLRAAIDAL